MLKNIYFITIQVVFLQFAIAQTEYLLAESELKRHQHVGHNHELGTEVNDSGYDVTHYRLDFNTNPVSNDFSGTTTVTFTSLEDINSIVLDAKTNLTIQNVTYQGNNLTTYSREGNKLTITFPNIITIGSSDSVSISFSGNAGTSSGFFTNIHNGTPVSYTLSEPFHAMSWWVCKDDLTDKADSIDIYVTHPVNMKAASNGLLISTTTQGSNIITHWRHNYPIVTYLVAIAVTNYVEYNNSVIVNGTEVPIINYVYEESLSDATYNLDRTPSFISFLSEKFGEYPFKNEKYGHAQWNFGGGMEHSTMSFMGSWGTNLVAHELVHQWTGNMVTCATWHDIWINEGFATYGAAVVRENFDSYQTFLDWKEYAANLVTAENRGSVYNPDAEDQNRIFNHRLSYQKAGMIVHWLRFKLGDELFFNTIENFLHEEHLMHNFADTEQFKESIENYTGMDFTEYVNDWIYGEGHPVFDISLSTYPGSNQISFTVNQSQSHPSVSFFETPFDIEFRGNNGQSEIRKFELTTNGQVFHVSDLPFQVTSYQFNPNWDIIAVVNSATMNNLEQTITEDDLKIYPNPAKDFFNVEFNRPIDEIIVFDSSGKMVIHQTQINDNILNINATNWSAGIYVVYIKSGANGFTRKILKK